MLIVRFDQNTLLPIGVYDSPLPPYQTQLGIIEAIAPDNFALEDDMFSLCIDGGVVENDYQVALLLAKSRAVERVRTIAEGVLSESDIRVRVCGETHCQINSWASLLLSLTCFLSANTV